MNSFWNKLTDKKLFRISPGINSEEMVPGAGLEPA